MKIKSGLNKKIGVLSSITSFILDTVLIQYWKLLEKIILSIPVYFTNPFWNVLEIQKFNIFPWILKLVNILLYKISNVT